jgi:membrane associated rhomboid family serine protease
LQAIPYILCAIILAAVVNGLISVSPRDWAFAPRGKVSAAATSKYQWPIATIATLLVTGIFTALQFPFPGVLDTLRRNPQAFASGEWWRIVTSVLVHSDGWPQIVFNFVAIAVFGVVAERIFGHWRWLLLYLVGGIAGGIAGYTWEPLGAGASVGLFGLVGGLLAWQLLSLAAPRARIAAIVGLAAAVALLVMRDIHGCATLAGACLAALLLWQALARWGGSSRHGSSRQ